jgi:threonine synthase
MAAHFSLDEMRQLILGAHVTDDETRKTITEVHAGWGYFLDPHSAVGWRAADKLAEAGKLETGPLAVLSTAHPGKFAETVEPLTGPVPFPSSLKKAMERTVNARTIPAELSALKELL